MNNGTKTWLLLSGLSLIVVNACGDAGEPAPDDSATGGAGGGLGGGDLGGAPSANGDTYHLGGAAGELPKEFESHPPACDEMLPLADLPIRLFADDGHLFYFEVSPAAARTGDAKDCKKAAPPAGAACPNFADNVRVQPFGMSVCADTGKIEVDLRGGDNFRPWLEIPTINFDSGEFSPQTFGQGVSQLRFQNGQNGRTIVREAVALRIWRALGFPAPSNSFVKTQSNIWDTAVAPGTWAAHLLVERYKKNYFEDTMPDALSVWEGEGDPFFKSKIDDGWLKVDCEWSAEEGCDDEPLQALATALRDTPEEGFYEATTDLVDWPSVHAFQCLSALTDTGIDWIHAGENVVLVLTTEGKIRYLPYNLDSSGGLLTSKGSPTPYRGSAYLAQRCAADPECEEAGRLVCEDLLDTYDTLDVPTSIVDERCDTLSALKLTRPGDVAACRDMREFYENTSANLRDELADL